MHMSHVVAAGQYTNSVRAEAAILTLSSVQNGLGSPGRMGGTDCRNAACSCLASLHFGSKTLASASRSLVFCPENCHSRWPRVDPTPVESFCCGGAP